MSPPRGTRWPLPLIEVAAGTVLFRLTKSEHADPAFFGRTGLFRFDAPDGAFGVCYLGTTLDCTFLEVFTVERDPSSGRLFVAATRLSEHYAAVARVTRPLRLAHLADDGLARLGIDQRVTGGDDYRLSQRWAAAIPRHPANVDGVFYATRHHNQLYAVALFDRARETLQFSRWGTLGDRATSDLWVQLDGILERFGIAALPDD